MKNKDYALIVSEAAKASCETLVSITRAKTARCIKYSNEIEHDASRKVEDWFQCVSANEFRSHPSANMFRKKIELLPNVIISIPAFRGRRFDKKDFYNKLEFGPPPLKYAKSNRYSTEFEPALYLSDSTYGVHAELKESIDTEPFLFCQKYHINSSAIDIVDLSSRTLSPLVSQAFDKSELNIDQGSYWKSHIIAELVKQAGFNGMIVPGVRGTQNNHYRNIIIFCPEEKWRYNTNEYGEDKLWVDVYNIIGNEPPVYLEDMQQCI